jgi:hypothetical protein
VRQRCEHAVNTATGRSAQPATEFVRNYPAETADSPLHILAQLGNWAVDNAEARAIR